MVKCADTHKCVPELFLLLFQSSSLLAHVGDVFWPLSFSQPEMRTAGFLFGEIAFSKQQSA